MRWQLGLVFVVIVAVVLFGGQQDASTEPAAHRVSLDGGAVSLDALSAAIKQADVNADSKLSREELAHMIKELSSAMESSYTPASATPKTPIVEALKVQATAQQPAVAQPALESGAASPLPSGRIKIPVNPNMSDAAPSSTQRRPGVERAAARELPQCSLLFYYHIVKTGGTTMRTVLQRQALTMRR